PGALALRHEGKARFDSITTLQPARYVAPASRSRRFPLLHRNLGRHFGRRWRVRYRVGGFSRRCWVCHGDPTLGTVSSRRTLGDRSRSVARVASLAIQEIAYGHSESQGTADAFQDVGRPRLPELSKGLDVDAGVRHGPEGRHEPERRADDDEQHPRGTEGTGPVRKVSPRTLR